MFRTIISILKRCRRWINTKLVPTSAVALLVLGITLLYLQAIDVPLRPEIQQIQNEVPPLKEGDLPADVVAELNNTKLCTQYISSPRRDDLLTRIFPAKRVFVSDNKITLDYTCFFALNKCKNCESGLEHFTRLGMRDEVAEFLFNAAQTYPKTSGRLIALHALVAYLEKGAVRPEGLREFASQDPDRFLEKSFKAEIRCFSDAIVAAQGDTPKSSDLEPQIIEIMMEPLFGGRLIPHRIINRAYENIYARFQAARTCETTSCSDELELHRGFPLLESVAVNIAGLFPPMFTYYSASTFRDARAVFSNLRKLSH